MPTTFQAIREKIEYSPKRDASKDAFTMLRRALRVSQIKSGLQGLSFGFVFMCPAIESNSGRLIAIGLGLATAAIAHLFSNYADDLELAARLRRLDEISAKDVHANRWKEARKLDLTHLASHDQEQVRPFEQRIMDETGIHPNEASSAQAQVSTPS